MSEVSTAERWNYAICYLMAAIALAAAGLNLWHIYKRVENTRLLPRFILDVNWMILAVNVLIVLFQLMFRGGNNDHPGWAIFYSLDIALQFLLLSMSYGIMTWHFYFASRISELKETEEGRQSLDYSAQSKSGLDNPENQQKVLVYSSNGLILLSVVLWIAFFLRSINEPNKIAGITISVIFILYDAYFIAIAAVLGISVFRIRYKLSQSYNLQRNEFLLFTYFVVCSVSSLLMLVSLVTYFVLWS